ncbi:FRG domain-containing protein [Clostridium sp. 'deep sea']|uniref:FRG domain-containing protein n=1 Tax=Clostridium sp. 'deep sea' TaxID=2779445 RepID=UPI00189670BB|nr:FRG domain-containing protein [Clostridium sp. 'deep sea']QOR35161.1 FRG domain-containing protein [Clostridium sp. 'deep sea']
MCFNQIYEGNEIKNIEDLSKIINEFNGFTGNCYADIVVFRGQKNISWDIIPSVFRDNLVVYESQIIKDLIKRNYHEFAGYSNINILTKLQHYSAPTRLIDVTTNPLVALYFACEDNQVDGSLYIIGMPVLSSINYVNLLAFIAKEDKLSINSKQAIRIFNKFFPFYDEKDDSEKVSLLKFYLSNSYLFFPEINTQRLNNQSGAFIIMGNLIETIPYNKNKTVDTLERYYNRNFKYNSKENPLVTLPNAIRKYKIPKENKSELRSLLNIFGINESTLFPELEYSCRYISRKYKLKLTSYK